MAAQLLTATARLNTLTFLAVTYEFSCVVGCSAVSTAKSLPIFRKTAVPWKRRWLFTSRQGVKFKKSKPLSKDCLLFSIRVEFRRLRFGAIPGEFLTWVLLCLWFLYLGVFWFEYFCGFDLISGDFCLEYFSDLMWHLGTSWPECWCGFDLMVGVLKFWLLLCISSFPTWQWGYSAAVPPT